MNKRKKTVSRERKTWETEEFDFLKMVGQNIVKIKKEKGLTSKFVYEALEIDKSNYRRIEAGKTNPSILLLQRIAKILNTDLNNLLMLKDTNK